MEQYDEISLSENDELHKNDNLTFEDSINFELDSLKKKLEIESINLPKENIFIKVAKNKLKPIVEQFRMIPLHIEAQDKKCNNIVDPRIRKNQEEEEEEEEEPRNQTQDLDKILISENVGSFYNIVKEEGQLVDNFFKEIQNIGDTYNAYINHREKAKNLYRQLLDLSKRKTTFMTKSVE